MVIITLGGGLGNQLFAYAFGRWLSCKMNTELKFDITPFKQSKLVNHEHYYFDKFNIKAEIATPEELASVNDKWIIIKNGTEMAQMGANIFVASGHWMFSENYFLAVKDKILEELTPKEPLHDTSALWREKILAAECSVSLHIRHGDTLGPRSRFFAGVLPFDYYFECLNALAKMYPQLKVFVFSDDLDWAENNLKLKYPTEFVRGCENTVEEFYIMSLCSHNIVANSTFSWWGACLNRNPDKKVFMPNPFYRKGYLNNIILPQSWIKVPVNYDRNSHLEFSPTLSIILYVDDNINFLPITLLGIRSQIFDDYDLIIVDSSADGVDNICRNFVNPKKLSLLKVSHATNKFTAWNIGINCARGEFLLFLTVKDFILPDAVNSLAQVWEERLSNKMTRTDRYITNATYNTVAPDIVCTSNFLEENPNGTATVDGINDKMFAIMQDAPFKGLNAITPLTNDDRQKLMLLASGQINNLLGTKFFKREFLNEHKIRFDESKQGGVVSELKFLTDAFLSTENITLMPQIFYGRLK